MPTKSKFSMKNSSNTNVSSIPAADVGRDLDSFQIAMGKIFTKKD
jgi:hypothetical protein